MQLSAEENLAGAVVAAGDEAVAVLVEGAVGEGQDMRAQHLEEVEVREGILRLLVDELLHQRAQRLAPMLRRATRKREELVAVVAVVDAMLWWLLWWLLW